MSRNHCITKRILMTLTFDLKACETKFNTWHVLTKTNQRVKYESVVINSYRDNERKPFCFVVLQVTHVTLTFDLVSPKSIGVLSLPRPISTWNMKALWYVVLKIMIGNHLVNRQTDCLTDIQTNISKTICPLFFKGGGGIKRFMS